MRSSSRVLPLVGALTIVCCSRGEPAKPIPTLALGGPVILAGSYSAISGVAELGESGLILVDSREKIVWLLDPSGESIQISRGGPAWNEYSAPTKAFSCGDSAIVYDAGLRKLLIINSQGTVTASVGVADRFFASTPMGTDAACRVYFEGPGGGPGERDSADIFGWPLKSRDSTPFGLIRATQFRDHAVTRRTSGRASTMHLLLPEPFSSGDEWIVAGDSSVILLRNGPLQILRLAAGGAKSTLLGTIELAQVPVTAHDKSRLSPPGVDIDWDLPATKPPIVDGSAFGTRAGTILVQLHQPSGSPEKYLVLDTTGAVAGAFDVPDSQKVVGFGQRGVYTSAPTIDDLVTLRRYSIVLPQDR